MRRAVVLFNLGGPSSTNEIEPFLKSLFSDASILPFPEWLRKPLANLIASRRKPAAEEIYAKLGGKSPLLENTRDQASALQKVLGDKYKVFVAMRHAHPFIEEVVKDVKAFQPHELVLLPLYPQFSTTTTGSAFKEWDRQERLQQVLKPQNRVCCYPEMPGFIEALADLTLQQFPAFSTAPRLLFSAHGLPRRIIQGGDPYSAQVERTFKKVVRKIKEHTRVSVDATICYQSRVGPGAWTNPIIDEELKRAAADQKSVLVVPISFVSEHSETLVELDIEYAEKAQRWGIPVYKRVPTVGCHPLFIEGLAALVKARGVGVSCSVGWKKCWRR